MNEQGILRQEFPIPPNTGKSGFLEIIKRLLRNKGIQKIVVNVQGTIEVFIKGAEIDDIGNLIELDMENLTPGYILRQLEPFMYSVPHDQDAAHTVIGMLSQVPDGLFPSFFAVGSFTSFQQWFTKYGLWTSTQSLLNLPLYEDPLIPHNILALFFSPISGSSDPMDAKKAILVDIPYEVPRRVGLESDPLPKEDV